MTGPGPGKLLVKGEVLLSTDKGSEYLTPCSIYIHVKGYSRARVTHVDIESPKLEPLRVRYGDGLYAYVYGLAKGFKVIFKRYLVIDGKRVLGLIVRWEGPKILDVGKSSICFVGFKEGGIYIGFKKEVIKRLEDYSKSLGVVPK
ncbi:MAG TPA: hypothetical protein ENF75_02700 [Acidilobales archaeon]|nr:hypothetical protein [Acidilobales archaeon]